MIIEKFDFRAFFNTKNVTNIQILKDKGIGAVSVITPRQAITRITDKDFNYRIKGLGFHTLKIEKIAKEILGIKEESYHSEGWSIFKEDTEKYVEWLFSKENKAKREEESNRIKGFLNSVIKIHYTSGINFDIVEIKLPTFGLENSAEDSKLRISKEMYECLNEILTNLEDIGLPSTSIKTDGLSVFKKREGYKYEEIKQQSIQEEGELEKD